MHRCRAMETGGIRQRLNPGGATIRSFIRKKGWRGAGRSKDAPHNPLTYANNWSLCHLVCPSIASFGPHWELTKAAGPCSNKHRE